MQSFWEGDLRAGVSAGNVSVVLRVFSCGISVYHCVQYTVQLWFLCAAGEKFRKRQEKVAACGGSHAECGDFVLL